MRNFKKIVPRALVVLVFLWFLNAVGKFLYEPVNDNLPITEAELKDSQGEIETLLLGTSLMHVGMDTNVLSKELDSVCFNISTSSQPMAGSYRLLEDQIKRNPVKRVFYGVGAGTLRSDAGRANTTAKVRVLKMLLSPVEKTKFLLDIAEPKELESLLFCPARTENTLSWHTVKRNVKYKLSDDFKNRVSYKRSKYTYYGMGYESNDTEYKGLTKEDIPQNNVWDRSAILEENVLWIKKMAALCNKKGVEFNLVVFPHAEDYSAKQGDLSDMDAYLEELAEEISAGLYNYNYTTRPDIHTRLPASSFMDGKHLNETGAVTLAHLLAQDYMSRNPVRRALHII